MALTNGQKRALHTAWRASGLATGDAAYDEHWRRTIQQRIGGFFSAADPTASRAGYIAVMAWYERVCEKRGMQLAATAGYWQAEDVAVNPTDALVYKARQLGEGLGMDEDSLDRFLAGKHMSRGTCDEVATASAYWLRRLVEALKAMAARRRTTRHDVVMD